MNTTNDNQELEHVSQELPISQTNNGMLQPQVVVDVVSYRIRFELNVE